MILRNGIPRLDEADELFRSDFYQRMQAYDEAFVARFGHLTRRAVLRWVGRPMRQWSRRWEYPFAAGRILDRAAAAGDHPLRILDAGSGVTFFPHFLTENIPGATVTCCDSDRRYVDAFSRLREATGNASVTFVPAMLQDLPLEADGTDVITCISVLEHTGRYDEILTEFARVLRPGGMLVLTFDISPDGRTEIPPSAARELLDAAAGHFDVETSFDPAAELARLDAPAALLTTDAARRSDPNLLPWKWPMLKSIYDLLHGRGWSGGFFSLACCCLAARAKDAPPSGKDPS